MDLKWKIHKFDFTPDAHETTQTDVCVMDVHRGTFVRAVMLQIGVAFDGTTPTLSVGDDGSAIGFVTTVEAAATADGLKNGIGAYLNSIHAASNANGKLYTEDDTIDLDFTSAGEGTTEGQCTVIVVYAEIE